MTDKNKYNKWKDIGLLDGFSEERGTQLAVFYEDALSKIMEQNLEDQSTSLFPILYRMFTNEMEINVDTLIDQVCRYYDCDFYKKSMNTNVHFFDIDAESELNRIFVEHYDDIEGIITGDTKIILENDLNDI